MVNPSPPTWRRLTVIVVAIGMITTCILVSRESQHTALMQGPATTTHTQPAARSGSVTAAITGVPTRPSKNVQHVGKSAPHTMAPPSALAVRQRKALEHYLTSYIAHGSGKPAPTKKDLYTAWLKGMYGKKLGKFLDINHGEHQAGAAAAALPPVVIAPLASTLAAPAVATATTAAAAATVPATASAPPLPPTTHPKIPSWWGGKPPPATTPAPKPAPTLVGATTAVAASIKAAPFTGTAAGTTASAVPVAASTAVAAPASLPATTAAPGSAAIVSEVGTTIVLPATAAADTALGTT